MDDTNVRKLDGFNVVGVRDKGVYITDGMGNVWSVAPADYAKRGDNKLAEAFANAFEGE